MVIRPETTQKLQQIFDLKLLLNWTENWQNIRAEKILKLRAQTDFNFFGAKNLSPSLSNNIFTNGIGKNRREVFFRNTT